MAEISGYLEELERYFVDLGAGPNFDKTLTAARPKGRGMGALKKLLKNMGAHTLSADAGSANNCSSTHMWR